ncbi:UBP-type zinc finger domain-containing protein [Hymenobacter sp. BT175]|uniref:UBP-type zinc finger domain-containing protein n=1 Tax=Hymenobacter translucens TaxID=2886507 RepID=UPI001D0DF317|nr:UBP-type zinc finger domain-containing protein [Hymenobacter translucens]MCC2546913.1 UBP-type zinc finger domain-containing protein [Hymenobacter translucens]
MPDVCQHLASVQSLKTAPEYVCPECVARNETWVHLRVCQECGHVGCCDSSKNKHATKHFHRSGHAVVASAEPGEQWLWCYEDEQMVKY